jgi:uncharacterized hydrophobic protein (TIGR00271 family)
MKSAGSRIYTIVKQWLAEKAAQVDSPAVSKTVHDEVEISAGYFLILSIANLIALCGLIMNSSPVIIGAMLISPLMGPILSFGFSFVTGDRGIWRSSVRKISVSVVLTILVAAVATYFSPLKDLTTEILSRTKPNLFDLIIAFLAGIAGAGAICTRKNFMTIVPGVAIATAVIPPLSVAGFGLGTWNFTIFIGGFFLFFTNFVAIILSTCAVFSFYGFRPAIFLRDEFSKLKKRYAFLTGVLVLISVPLVYTLHKTISEIRLRASIRDSLRHELDREKRSRLATFSYAAQRGKELRINAIVNTVAYFRENEILAVEKDISESLRRKVVLDLEQIKVQSGGLREEAVAKPLPPPVPPEKPPWEQVRDLQGKVISMVGRSAVKIDGIISPAEIVDFTVTFHENSPILSVFCKVRRDAPFSDAEKLWMQRMLARDLNLQLELRVETTPFVPLLLFKDGESALSDEMKKSILAIKDVYSRDPNMIVQLESFAGKGKKEKRAVFSKRLSGIKEILVKECKVPESRMRIVINDRRSTVASIRISLMESGQALESEIGGVEGKP